jgi:phosphohistidine phosphatase
MRATNQENGGLSAMDLILWRHAEAIDVELVGDDMLRTLTPRGEKQAARMAAWLDRQLPDSARVWASPAARTEQTAKALGRKFKVNAALAPLASASQLLELVQWPDAKGAVLVVGHQPTLGKVLSQLLGLTDAECAVKKGAVWWLRYREREDAAKTVVVTVQSPDLL